MPLPSQTLSNNVRGRYMYRRRRKRRRPMVMLVICAACVGGLWWYLAQRNEGANPPPAVQANAPATLIPSAEAELDRRTLETTVRSSPTPVHQPTPTTTPAPGWQIPQATPLEDTTTIAEVESLPVIDTPSSFLASSDAVSTARQYLAGSDLLSARKVLSDALATDALSHAQEDEARYMTSAINDRLVFSNEIVNGDPYCFQYIVQPGDSLDRIVKRLGLQVDWRFIQRINGLARPNLIRPGQSLKVVTGPFHAEVDRDNHRLSLYLGEDPDRIYVRDFLVGLGEFDTTPSGLFRVRRGNKMINPDWTNPRTGEKYSSNNPENPIGEYWMGLEGIESHNLQHAGFGVHGTIDPGSIGRNQSMGCVRLGDGDIDLLYEVLTEGVSTVWVNEPSNMAGVPGG